MKQVSQLFICLAFIGITLGAKAQDGGKVTVHITKEANGVVTEIDTTFEAEDMDEVNEVLKKMGLDEAGPDESLEKTIVFHKGDEDSFFSIGKGMAIAGKPGEFRFHQKLDGKVVLGLYLSEDKSDDGVIVSGVMGGGSADKAGIKKGDIIIKIGDTRIKNEDDIKVAKEGLESGDKVTVSFLRNGKSQDADLELTSGMTWFFNHKDGDQASVFRINPNVEFDFDRDFWSNAEANDKAFLGVSLTDDENGGVRVVRVTRGSAADDADLREGDVIVKFDTHDIGNYTQLKKLINSHKPGEKVNVQFLRNGKKQKADITLGSRGDL